MLTPSQQEFINTGSKFETALANFIEKYGLFTFLRVINQYEGPPVLNQFCEILGLPIKSQVGDMIKSIADEIMLSGSEELFSQFPEQLLISFLVDLELTFKPNDKKEKLVDCIMVHAFELEPLESFQKLLHGESDSGSDEDRPLKKRKVDTVNGESISVSTSGKKAKYVCPPLSNIKKGITRDDLQNKYNVTDLQQWCKENGLASSGKKPQLIKHILEYLQTGEKKNYLEKEEEKIEYKHLCYSQ